MTANASGFGCSEIAHFQINAAGEECSVEYSGGDMQGISSEAGSLYYDDTNEILEAVWTVPEVPRECWNKEVDLTSSEISIDGPPGEGTMVDRTEDVDGSVTFLKKVSIRPSLPYLPFSK